jgi:ABC-type antimicrobial peptide transport system permease subunit
VFRMVLRESLGTTCVGLGIGAPVAYWDNRLASSLIQDLPTEAFPIAIGAMMMIAITLAAAYVPSRRAMRVDPTEALRHE